MKQSEKADLKLNYDSQHNNWRMAKDQNHAQGPGHYPGLSVKYDNDGNFTFVIQNPQGVTFAKSGAFTPKATQATMKDFSAQFTVTGEGTDTLVVKDANANKDGSPYSGGDYPYELHFSNGTTLDPIITNGGCCRPPLQQSSLAFYALGGVALLALFILVIRPILARRSPASSDAAMKDREKR